MKIRGLKLMFICGFLFLSGCNPLSMKSSNVPVKPDNAEEHVIKKPIPRDFVPSNLNVVAIGDSLTAGVGDTENNGGYVGDVSDLLQKEENISSVDLANFGVKGHKTTDLLKVLQKKEVLEKLREANIILMTIGGNDIMKVTQNHIMNLDLKPYRDEQPFFEKRMNKIFQTVRTANSDAVIVYTGLYNPFKLMLPELGEIDTIIEEWNRTSSAIVIEDGNAIFIPIEDIFSRNSIENLLYTDEFHPSETGYSLIADRVYSYLSD